MVSVTAIHPCWLSIKLVLWITGVIEKKGAGVLGNAVAICDVGVARVTIVDNIDVGVVNGT